MVVDSSPEGEGEVLPRELEHPQVQVLAPRQQLLHRLRLGIHRRLTPIIRHTRAHVQVRATRRFAATRQYTRRDTPIRSPRGDPLAPHATSPREGTPWERLDSCDAAESRCCERPSRAHHPTRVCGTALQHFEVNPATLHSLCCLVSPSVALSCTLVTLK
jgi:hypothetical protein